MNSTPQVVLARISRPWKMRASSLVTGGLLFRVVRWALGLAAMFIATLAIGLLLYSSTHADRVYEGVTLAGVPVGGMTEAEARAAVEQAFEHYHEHATLPLEHGATMLSLEVHQTGVALNAEASVAAAFAYGRQGSIWQRSRAWARALIRNQSIPLSITIDQALLDDRLTELAQGVIYPPADAVLVMDPERGPEIAPEQPGLAFNLSATRALVVHRLEMMSTQPVPLVTTEVAPRVVAKDLQDELAAAQAIASRAFVVTGLDQQWSIAPDWLQRLIQIPHGGGQVSVDRDAIAAFVDTLAQEIERPAVNASVTLSEEGTFVAVSGKAGIKVDRDRSTKTIVDALVAGERSAALAIQQVAPEIADSQAASAAARANDMVARGLVLQWDGGSVQLGAADLVQAVVITANPGAQEPFAIQIDHAVLVRLLKPLADQIAVPAQDARFRLVNNRIKVVEREVVGRELDTEAAAMAIADALLGGRSSATLPVVPVKPAVTAAQAKTITLPDVLAEASTYYGNSSEPRRHNVETAVRLENGWLVPPGGQFSYVEHVGKVSEAEGFVTGFGIVASPENDGTVTTAPVVGGGICQVSTTIFQAAFWAGLRIDERYEHPYWLQTYGEPPRGMKGLDAMVNVEDDWSLDLKFTNTTGNWIAVVVTADGERVTAQIRGTNPGWTVQVFDPVITNVVPSDTRTYYTESPELPQGQELQVETAQEGFTATVHRVVTGRDGQVVDDYVLTSTYAPSRNTILRGTGPSNN